MHKALNTAGAALALAALSLLATPTAQAQPAPAGAFTLTATYDDGTRLEQQLTCYPHGGSHPRPYGACTALTLTDAHPDQATPWTTACPDLYRPVTTTLTGTWFGRRAHHEDHYANACQARTETAGIYDFPL